MGSKREAVVSIRPAVLVFRAVAEMLPAAVATSIFVARFFFFAVRRSSSFALFLFLFSILYSFKRITWMNAEKRHRVFSSILLSFFSFGSFFPFFVRGRFGWKLEEAATKADGKMVRNRGDIENVFRLILRRYFSGIVQRTTATRR